MTESRLTNMLYRVAVKDDDRTWYSDPVSVAFIPKLTITEYMPLSTIDVAQGSDVVLRVAPSGGTGSYSWYRAIDATAIGTQVGWFSDLFFTASMTYNRYYYYCVVTSGTQSVTSRRVQLVIAGIVSVSEGNNDVEVTAGNETLCRFVAPSAGSYIFTTTGSSDTVGVLYDASMNQIARDDDSGEGLNFQIEYTLDQWTDGIYRREILQFLCERNGNAEYPLETPVFNVTVSGNSINVAWSAVS